MKSIMLDTNILRGLLKAETKAMAKLAEFKNHTFVISFLVYAEFMAGAQLIEKKGTRKFLQQFKVYNYDAKAHSVAKSFLDKYFVGRENPPMDLLIAAHAKSLNLAVITDNAKDFIFKEVQTYHYSKSSWF